MSKQLTVEDFYTEIEHAATVAAPLFKLYGWTWANVPGDGVPNHNQLVDGITRLADRTLRYFNESRKEFPEAMVGSGRFTVRMKQWEDEREFSIQLDLASKSQFKDWA